MGCGPLSARDDIVDGLTVSWLRTKMAVYSRDVLRSWDVL
jgi:hypothetical protein